MYFTWNIAVCFSVCFVISETLKENNFSIKSEKTIDVPSALMKKVVVGSLIKCAYLCGADTDCTHGVFKSDGVECWLYSANGNISLNESMTDTVVVKCGKKELRKETGYYGLETGYYDFLYIRSSDLGTIDLNYVLFDVKSGDRFSLAFYQQTTWAFAVYLGLDGGTRLNINNGHNDYQFVNHDTPPYNRTSYKPFWITWTNTTVEVGTGHIVGTERFLHHNTIADIPTIDMIEIRSYYNGKTNWVFVSQDRCD